MATMLPPVKSTRRWLQTHSERWEAFQSNTTSQRLLSERDRQRGYAVVHVPPPLREVFLDVVRMLRLYQRVIHQPRRVLSARQLRSLADFAMATQALIATLKEDV